MSERPTLGNANDWKPLAESIRKAGEQIGRTFARLTSTANALAQYRRWRDPEKHVSEEDYYALDRERDMRQHYCHHSRASIEGYNMSGTIVVLCEDCDSTWVGIDPARPR